MLSIDEDWPFKSSWFQISKGLHGEMALLPCGEPWETIAVWRSDWGAQNLEAAFHHQDHLRLNPPNISLFMSVFWPVWYRLQLKKKWKLKKPTLPTEMRGSQVKDETVPIFFPVTENPNCEH